MTSLRCFSREKEKDVNYFFKGNEEPNSTGKQAKKIETKIPAENRINPKKINEQCESLWSCERLASSPENQNKFVEVFAKNRSLKTQKMSTDISIQKSMAEKIAQKKKFKKEILSKEEYPKSLDLNRTANFQSYLQTLGNIADFKEKKGNRAGITKSDEFSIYSAISNRQSILKDLVERLTHKRKAKFSLKCKYFFNKKKYEF